MTDNVTLGTCESVCLSDSWGMCVVRYVIDPVGDYAKCVKRCESVHGCSCVTLCATFRSCHQRCT